MISAEAEKFITWQVESFKNFGWKITPLSPLVAKAISKYDETEIMTSWVHSSFWPSFYIRWLFAIFDKTLLRVQKYLLGLLTRFDDLI